MAILLVTWNFTKREWTFTHVKLDHLERDSSLLGPKTKKGDGQIPKESPPPKQQRKRKPQEAVCENLACGRVTAKPVYVTKVYVTFPALGPEK